MTTNKSLSEITGIYFFVGIIGFVSYCFLPINNDLLRLLVADIIMTIATYAISLNKKNSSVYDAYWSVIPFYFILIWCFSSFMNTHHCIAAIIVCIWSWRLTINWYRSFPGWHHEDWRYIAFRKQHGKNFEWLNFFGIHLYPTLIVFLCCSGLYYFFKSNSITFPNRFIAGAIIACIGIALEYFADNTLFRFRNKPIKINGEILRDGLWKYSRHPNYLGEMLFWIGIAFIGMSAAETPWWTMLGAIGIVAMFLFASIPMKEKRLIETKPDAFKKYKTEVSMLFPLPVKNE